jgi:hypothetical protein
MKWNPFSKKTLIIFLFYFNLKISFIFSPSTHCSISLSLSLTHTHTQQDRPSSAKILVAGHRGLVCSAIVRKLRLSLSHNRIILLWWRSSSPASIWPTRAMQTPTSIWPTDLDPRFAHPHRARSDPPSDADDFFIAKKPQFMQGVAGQPMGLPSTPVILGLFLFF